MGRILPPEHNLGKLTCRIIYARLYRSNEAYDNGPVVDLFQVRQRKNRIAKVGVGGGAKSHCKVGAVEYFSVFSQPELCGRLLRESSFVVDTIPLSDEANKIPEAIIH